MINLLKADLYRLIKSKMTYILLIVCFGVSLFTLGIDVVMKVLMKTVQEETGEPIPELFTGKSIMFGCFSLSSDYGLLLSIFAGVFTLLDIRHGTIRNKVMIGESKTFIYLSHLITSMVLCVGAIIFSFIILAIGANLIFGYGYQFDSKELVEFIKGFLIGIDSFIFLASISTFFSLITKSTPLTIIFTILITIGLVVISSLSNMAPESLKYLFYLVPSYATIVVTGGGILSLEVFWCGLISLLVFTALNTVLGIVLFNKIDLK